MKTKILLILFAFLPMVYSQTTQGDRAKAERLKKAGNFKEAYEIYRQLLAEKEIPVEKSIKDFDQAIYCINKLSLHEDFDELIEVFLEKRQKDWQAQAHMAKAYLSKAYGSGRIVNGKFKRGHNTRSRGVWVNSQDYDRTLSIAHFEKAYKLLPENLNKAQKSNFFWSFSTAIFKNRGYNQAYFLQNLTDSSQIPDLTQGQHHGYRYNSNSRPPVTATGQPFFYSIPASYEEAENDGERWRWLMSQAAENGNVKKADETYANFLYYQFGVHNLRQYSWFFNKNSVANEEAILSLDKLSDDETITNLASGISKFTLPAEHNYIAMYKKMMQAGNRRGYRQLATIYLDRRQYDKATHILQETLKKWPKDSNAKKQLKQVLGNWGEFAAQNSSYKGKTPTFDFRFRNGAQVTFKASRVNLKKILQEKTDYLRTKPQRLDYQYRSFDNLADQVLKGGDNYLTGEVEKWQVKLTPAAGHFTSRISLEAPINKSGAWLIESQMADGNKSHMLLWVEDTIIVQKVLDNKQMLYVADAVSGEPLKGITVNFFGFRHQFVKRHEKKNIYEMKLREFSRQTDERGLVLLDSDDIEKDENKTWLITVDSHERFSYLGFNGLYLQKLYDHRNDHMRSYLLTDRPIYKPGQKVEYKVWTANSSYDSRRHQVHEGTQNVMIYNPKGEKSYSAQHKSDQWGGVAGTFVLPEDATLGNYRIKTKWGSYTFRVEEYKKPEFEVKIETPTKPVALGEKITVKVNTSYYFGAPVSQGEVKIKVHRYEHNSQWFPAGPWDWLYGAGYEWSGIDCEWYPGWLNWGCKAPRPFWISWHQPPPELVTEISGNLAEDGTYSFEIDSSIAKVMYGEKSHRYQVSAEVTDRSRRTIVGSGQVIAAKQPFKTFVWTDRPYYNTGDKINFNFQARGPSGKGVEGHAKLKLLKITYDKDGKSTETLVKTKDLATTETGEGKWELTASQSGQYRISCKVKTASGIEQEGAVIFSIYGQDTASDNFMYNKLELLTDKQSYQPGETVKLRINSDQKNARVLLFVRPISGICPEPKMFTLDGKSSLVEVEVSLNDQPNFFIEALTVFEGKVHSAMKQVNVPPVDKMLKVEISPDQDDYLPGQEAQFTVKLKGPDGQPLQGSFSLSIYDKALEYLAGNASRSQIRSFFWSQKRQHYLTLNTNIKHFFRVLYADHNQRMQQLGVFGRVGELFVGGNNVSSRRSLSRKTAKMAASGSYNYDMPMETSGLAVVASAYSADQVDLVGGGSANLKEPKLRQDFADSAFWQATVKTNAQGEAKVSFKMPENLTAWKARCWGVADEFLVGEGEAYVTTSKNLLLRLQAPRFLVETDEVVISANVHNYLKSAKEVTVRLESNDLLRSVSNLTQKVSIPAGGEKRLDWRMKVVGEGEVKLRAYALSDEESDAVEMKLAAKVHGILKTDSFSAYLAPEKKSATMTLNLPAAINPAKTRLELRYSPTLAGSMVDALPYLADFPYGCTEQTLNRFLPTTITRSVLEEMDIDLDEISKKLTNLNAQEIGNDQQRARHWQRLKKNPVFDVATIKKMERAGVERLVNMQLSDGGWGWFSGYGERSSAHTTAYVVHGLQLARQNGVMIDDGVLKRGFDWLENYQNLEAIKIRNSRAKKTEVPSKKFADNLDAFVFMVLLGADRHNKEMQNYLYEDRNELAVYGKSLVALALHKLGEGDKVQMLKRNIEQYLVIDDENQTAYLELNNGGYWWNWYGSEFEAQAYYLKLLCKVDPKGKVAPQVVKYLINNRRHGTYWNSTRDTAICIEAMADYLKATGEMAPDMTVEILVDGEKVKETKINRHNLFSFDNRLVLKGNALGSGEHRIELRRQGKGPLYSNGYLTYFSKEKYIKPAGLEVKVERKFYKLVRKQDSDLRAGRRGQVIKANQEAYKRILLNDLETLKSGDLIEVELEIVSKNDYEYIVFEDLKASGFEAVQLRSGYRQIGGFQAYQEMRQDRVAFFITHLPRGQHNLSYRLRAEIPGKFSALPAKVYGNYAPELRGNSSEIKLQIED